MASRALSKAAALLAAVSSGVAPSAKSYKIAITYAVISLVSAGVRETAFLWSSSA
jgi:hypothetical protein